MSGLSDEAIFIIGEPDFGDKEFDKKYDKESQLHQLLVRNRSYMADIERLRKKFSVGQYPVEGGRSGYDKLLDPEGKDEREKFYEEVSAIAVRIKFPGDWEQAVRKHVVGYTPEVCFALSGMEQKKITGRLHNGYVELKLYGDLTVPDLRSALDKIRKLIADNQDKPKTNNSVKYRPRLIKNLLIFDMDNSGKSYQEIANYCEEQGLQHGMQQADVSKYIELAKKQIAKIYA